MGDLQSTTEGINSKSEKQLNEIANLQTLNRLLQSTVDTLNDKALPQSETILELSKQNSELSLQLAKSTETLHALLEGTVSAKL